MSIGRIPLIEAAINRIRKQLTGMVKSQGKEVTENDYEITYRLKHSTS